MKRIGIVINILVLLIGLACIGYYLALGLSVRFGQSLMILWPVIGGACVARFIIWTVIYSTDRYPPRGIVIALRALILLGLVFFFTVEGIILSGGSMKAQPGLKHIVVLGAKVNGTQPSGALRNRIQRAADYMKENPETVAVLTGGKGEDEGISEAQCMFEGMTARGIDPARLILEEQATDTAENLRYSRALIGETDSPVGIVTNDFHMFRALCLARKQSWNTVGIPVATTAISFPHYMLREFVGVVYETLRGNLSFR